MEEEGLNQELWVLKFSNCITGNKMRMAFDLVEGYDLLERYGKGARTRQDLRPWGT